MAVSAFGAQKRKWYKVASGVRWCRNLWGGSKVTVAEAVRWAPSSTIWMLVGFATRRSFRVVPLNGSWVPCACDWGPGDGTVGAPLQQSMAPLGIAKQLLLSVGYEAVAAIVLTACEPRKHPVLGCQRRSNPSSAKPTHPSHPFGASLLEQRCRKCQGEFEMSVRGKAFCRRLIGRNRSLTGDRGWQLGSFQGTFERAITAIRSFEPNAAIHREDFCDAILLIFEQEYVVVNCNGMYPARIGHYGQWLLGLLEEVEVGLKKEVTTRSHWLETKRKLGGITKRSCRKKRHTERYDDCR